MTTRMIVLDCGCKVVISFDEMAFDVVSADQVEMRGSMGLPCKLHGGA